MKGGFGLGVDGWRGIRSESRFIDERLVSVFRRHSIGGYEAGSSSLSRM